MLLIFAKVEVDGRENVSLSDIAVESGNKEPRSEVVPREVRSNSVPYLQGSPVASRLRVWLNTGETGPMSGPRETNLFAELEQRLDLSVRRVEPGQSVEVCVSEISPGGRVILQWSYLVEPFPSAALLLLAWQRPEPAAPSSRPLAVIPGS